MLSSAVPVFALAIVLMLGLLIPHLDLVAKPNRWVLPGAAAALGLGLLLFGTLTAGFDARHPRPNSILYALNADTAASHLGRAVMRRRTPGPPSSSEPTPERGRWPIILARKGSFTARRPRSTLPAPSIELLDDGTRDGVRTLRMRVTAPPEANLVVVEADAEAQVVGAAVNGKRVPEEPSNNGGLPAWTLNYWNPPSEGIDLTLDVKGAEPLTITARAGTPGLPDIPGKSYRDRPPDTMPIAMELSHGRTG